jgi:hypothetical protein
LNLLDLVGTEEDVCGIARNAVDCRTERVKRAERVYHVFCVNLYDLGGYRVYRKVKEQHQHDIRKNRSQQSFHCGLGFPEVRLGTLRNY